MQAQAQQSPFHLNPGRVAATSSVIALHLVVLGLLLVPTEQRIVQAIEVPSIMQVEWLKPPVAVIPPPIPVVPKPKAPEKSHTVQPISHQSSQAQTTAQTVSDDLPPIDPIDTQGPLNTHATIDPIATPASPPGLHVLHGPKPIYPRQSLAAREEGVVSLLVVVDGKGRATEVSITKSSGHRLLDRAARDQVLKNWRFEPTGTTLSATLEIAFAVE